MLFLTQISRIILGNCNLDGTIPSSFYLFSELLMLNIVNNKKLTGPLPFHNCQKDNFPTSLTILILEHNGFTGTLPSSYIT